MFHKPALLTGLTLAAAIALAVTVTPARPGPASPQGIGIAVRDGDLVSVDERGKTVRQLTAFGDVYTTFEPSAKGTLLFGRAAEVPIEGLVPMSLWSLNSNDQTRREVDDLVVRANMSQSGAVLVYETVNYQIAVLDRKSGSTTFLKGTEAEASSDGRFVVYNAIRKDATAFAMPRPSEGLALYDRAADTTVKLTDNPEDFNPFWAPDGSIIFGSANPEDGSGTGLFRITRKGGSRSLVVGADSADLQQQFLFPSERPRFTSDGTAMLAIVLDDSGAALWRVPLDGGTVTVDVAAGVYPSRDLTSLTVIPTVGSATTIPVR